MSLPVALIVGAGLVISVVATQTVQKNARGDAQAAFELTAEQAIDAIEDRINQHIQLTQSIVSLFHSSIAVERGEFTTFVAPALKRYPAIQGVGWIPRLFDFDRERFETLARLDGFKEFAFNERTADGKWMVAERREQYFPTFYLEPRPANELTLGFDLATNPTRLEAMERARDSGDAALSELVQFALADRPFALFVFAPVYVRKAVPDTVEQRRSDLTGFAYAQIRPSRLVETLSGTISAAWQATSGRRLDVFDTTDPSKPAFLFSYTPGISAGSHADQPMLEIGLGDFSRTTEFGGRTWRLIARGPVVATGLVPQAWMTLVATLVLTLLLAAYLQAMLHRQRAIQREVGLRTVEIELTNQLLRSSEDRIRTVTDSVPGLIAYLDRDLVYRFANRRYREVGLDPETMIGKTLHEVRGPTAAYERIRPYFERAAAGEKVTFELTVNVQGEQRWRQIDCSPDIEEDGTVRGFYAMSHDITAMKTVDRMKDEFVSTVSHELRTPLTSIKGALGIVRAKTRGTLPADLTQMLEIAYKNCDRLTLLINDILDIEKIEAGKMDFKMAPLDLVPVVSTAITANQSFADQFGVKLVLARAPEHAWISADEGRLMQVLANLISNAAKFSPQGGTVEIAIDRNGGSFRISVSDKGQGIPESQRGRIFQKLSQVDGSDRRKTGGTGLGLSIVRAIVEHHGGSADYVSEVGKGTMFFVDLPEAKPAADVAAQ